MTAPSASGGSEHTPAAAPSWRELAFTDPLTGLPNRRRLDEVIQGGWSRWMHDQTMRLANHGLTSLEIAQTLVLPDEFLEHEHTRGFYGDLVHNVKAVYQRYLSWYDGNPANLKPATEVALATEMASLAGGAEALAARAEELANQGDFRLACHLIEMAATATPDSKRIHEIRAAIYTERRKIETSFMATGIYRSAALDSKARIEEL